MAFRGAAEEGAPPVLYITLDFLLQNSYGHLVKITIPYISYGHVMDTLYFDVCYPDSSSSVV